MGNICDCLSSVTEQKDISLILRVVCAAGTRVPEAHCALWHCKMLQMASGKVCMATTAAGKMPEEAREVSFLLCSFLFLRLPTMPVCSLDSCQGDSGPSGRSTSK